MTLGYMFDPGSVIQLAFFIGAVKRDWLLILTLQTTFNVHFFFLCSLGASYKLNDDYHRQQRNKEL
jgi:hypothetical protein